MRKQTLHEIRLMIKQSLPHWKESITFWEEHDDEFTHADEDVGYITLTIGTNDWHGWAYQTGDNSLLGKAHGYKFWAEVLVWPESTVEDLMEDVAMQFSELGLK